MTSTGSLMTHNKDISGSENHNFHSRRSVINRQIELGTRLICNSLQLVYCILTTQTPYMTEQLAFICQKASLIFRIEIELTQS